MPRLPRIQIEGAIHYVSSKASMNQEIFKDKADYDMYLKLMSEYKGQHPFKLFSYCLMPDGLHLLVETGEDAALSEIMHHLNSLYTKYFNARYARKGHLFEARFRSVLVEKAQYLLPLTRHLHRLPDRFSEYPYSSHSIFIGKASGLDMAAEIKEVKEFLENKDDPAAYEKYCLENAGEEAALLEKKLRRGSVLGSDSFAGRVHAKVDDRAREREEAASARPSPANRMLIFMIGLGILVTSSSSVYLYISKASLKREYERLLQVKEAEFAEKTRFENVSPIALGELEGTEWQIEIVPTGEEGSVTIRDRVRFEGGRFHSSHFGRLGFGAAPFRLDPTSERSAVWHAAQGGKDGELLWSGDWQADAMKGNLTWNPAGGKAREFSFFSVKWSYIGKTEIAR